MAKSNLNMFTCSGNLTRDAEVHEFPNGGKVCNFSVAINDSFGNNGEGRTLFMNCAVYGKRAESNLPTYLTKGIEVIVTGRLVPNEYTNKEGTQVRDVRLNVSDLYFVGSRQSGDSAPVAVEPQDLDTEGIPF